MCALVTGVQTCALPIFAHMLVDAQARDFELVDPTPAGIIRTPPTVSFTVETAKFSGRVSVIYLRADDAYAVALHRDDEQVERRAIGRAACRERVCQYV